MKRKIISLLGIILIPFTFLFGIDNSFAPNRANIWVTNGLSSRSYSIEGWSENALLKEGIVVVSQQSVTTPSTTEVEVLINNVSTSFPAFSKLSLLPTLSLVGLDSATGTLGEELNKPSLYLEPNGGEFNTTIEVVVTLNGKPSLNKTIDYQIDSKPIEHKVLATTTGKNSFSIFLSKSGEHRIKYKFSDEATYQSTLFNINQANKNVRRDSDGDGIPDSVEIELGMNPLNEEIMDSDDDGWNDFDEYIRGTNKNAEGSSPIDSDNDGWSDWDERELRATLVNDNRSKPTANALYGAEYNISTLVNKPSIDRVSFVDVKAHTLYDSSRLLDLNTSSTYYNRAISPIINAQLKTSLQIGTIPKVRIPADTPLVERIQDANSSNSWVGKYYLASIDDCTVQKYYSEFNASLVEDFNASTFTQGYINYLKTHLISSSVVTVNETSSINIALLEQAFQSRIDLKSQLFLGHPDFPSNYDAYQALIVSLSQTQRNLNMLYEDLVSMYGTHPFITTGIDTLFNLNDGNSSEQRLINLMQDDLDEEDRYKISLMSIIDFTKTQSNATVWTPTLDTDNDAKSNKDEVLPIAYTNPLKADSDGDGINDNEDYCTMDKTNSCLNDTLSTLDSDNDGVIDAIDNCPNSKNGNQSDANGDGIGDECAQSGLVIVTPRTNIALLQGESFTFQAIYTSEKKADALWYIDDTIAAEGLTFSHYFEEERRHEICVGFSNNALKQSCVEVRVQKSTIGDANISLYTLAQKEGDIGEQNILVQLSLTKALNKDITYHYVSEAITATEGIDYQQTKGDVVFKAGETTQFIQVPIISDLEVEDNETLSLRVTRALDEQVIELTIIDDDILAIETPNPTLSLSLFDENDHELLPSNILEGDVDKNITLRLTLSKAVTKESTSIYYRLLQNETNSDEGNKRYPEYHSMFLAQEGDVDFMVGEQVKEINITILGDVINESDNNFSIVLENARNIELNELSSLQMTIKDNDPLPSISFEKDKYVVNEGNQLLLKIELSTKSYQTVEANISINQLSTAEDALDMDIDDYNLSTYHVVIEATQPNATTDNLMVNIELNTSNNTEGEDNESLILDIIAPVNTVIGKEFNSTNITIHEALDTFVLNRHLLFTYETPTTGNELWISDGTTVGTRILKDLVVGVVSSNPRFITRVNDNLFYFVAYDKEFNTILYKSDGTSTGTVPVKSFGFNQIEKIVVLGTKVYLILADSENFMVTIWTTDGTKAGTVFVNNLYKGYSIDANTMIAINETLYFAGNDTIDEFNTELYAFNATKNSVSLVKEIKEGIEASYPASFIQVKGLIYFIANNGEIWKSDGSPRGTVQLTKSSNTGDEYISHLHHANGYIYYVSILDKTTLNSINIDTEKVTTNIATYSSTTIDSMITIANSLYFTSTSNKGISQLVRVNSPTDIKTIYTLKEPIYTLKAIGDLLYFKANTELVVSDGITTKTLTDIGTGKELTFLKESLKNQLFFMTTEYNTEGNLNTLWKSKGTVLGTVAIYP